MKLTQISLQHFRNISEVTLDLSPGVNIFVGQNGQGKTNLIEAIFALSLSRPFRSRAKEVFLQHDQDFGRVKGVVQITESEEEELEIFWQQSASKKNGTVFRKNGVERSSTEFLKSKHFFAVLFSPEDMEIPFAAPKQRRQFLSRVLAPLFPDYLIASLQYDKVLRRRNKLLQEFPRGHIQKMEFDFWDSELSKWGQVLEKFREEFFMFLEQNIAEKYKLISQEKNKIQDMLSVRYLPSIPKDKDFFQVLANSFSKDARYGSTQKGPHRDDFELLINGKPLEQVASRGEIRSAIIALKLCERDFVAEHTSLFPVLLLDDVFSELDEVRRDALLQIFTNDQVFVSTTDLPKISNTKKQKIFEVRAGQIQENSSS